MMSDRIEALERRKSALFAERSTILSHWQELDNYIKPRAGRFFLGDRNKPYKGNARIINNTATLVFRTLSAGMMNGVTSRSRPWLNLRSEDPGLSEYKPAKAWLERAKERMLEIFQGSNLYTVLPQTYSDLGVFGTNSFLVLEDPHDTIRCYAAPVGSYALGTSCRGVVDTFVREFQKTAGQLVEWFGEEACSESVRVAARDNRRDTYFDVVQIIQPNPEYQHGKILSKQKAFTSIYYEPSAKEDKFLREAGFDSFPSMSPRWEVLGEDTYGMSPGMEILGDVKALQLEEKRKMQLIDKLTNPAVTGPSSLKNGLISTLPGAINFVDVHQGQQGLAPVYQVDPHLNELRQDILEIENRIRRGGYEDMFLLLSRDDRSNITASEILARNEEKMMVLGQVITRLSDELLDPLVDRTFNIMIEKRLLPPPPPELQGVKISAEYISILHQAMKMAGITGLEHLTAYTGNLAAVTPEVLDGFDAIEAQAAMAEMLGTPARVIRDKKQRDAIQAARAQQQNIEQGMALAQSGAQTAQTMADTNVTDPSLLQSMMNMAAGGSIA